MNRRKSSPRFRFTFTAALLVLLAFLLPALREGDPRLYFLAAGVTGALVLCMILPARLFALDRPLLALTLTLCAMGILAPAPFDPDAALLQLLRCGAGVAALCAGAVIVRVITPSLLTSGICAFLGLLLPAAGLLTPSPLPLSEAALALLIIACASLLASRSGIGSLALGLAGAALFLLQGQLWYALSLSAAVLLLCWSSDGRFVSLLVSLLLFTLLFLISLRLGFLPRPVLSEDHRLSAESLAASGLWGTEFSALPEGLPAASLLYWLAAGHGLVFTGLILLLFLPLLLRGVSTAAIARSRFHALLAMGGTLLIGLRVPAALLGSFGILPLPLIAPPLLTASLPDLAAQMLALGLVCGVSSINEASLAEDAHLAMLAK